jgi:hypothetical protein
VIHARPVPTFLIYTHACTQHTYQVSPRYFPTLVETTRALTYTLLRPPPQVNAEWSTQANQCVVIAPPPPCPRARTCTVDHPLCLPFVPEPPVSVSDSYPTRCAALAAMSLDFVILLATTAGCPSSSPVGAAASLHGRSCVLHPRRVRQCHSRLTSPVPGLFLSLLAYLGSPASRTRVGVDDSSTLPAWRSGSAPF